MSTKNIFCIAIAYLSVLALIGFAYYLTRNLWVLAGLTAVIAMTKKEFTSNSQVPRWTVVVLGIVALTAFIVYVSGNAWALCILLLLIFF